jgi:hypothetical protein
VAELVQAVAALVAGVLIAGFAGGDTRVEGVNDVVADLIGLAEGVTELDEDIGVVGAGPRGEGSGCHGEAGERGGLFQTSAMASAGDVYGLTADHAADSNFADGEGEEPGDGGEESVGFVEKRESGEQGDVVAEGDVEGGAATAQSGVVHGGKVIHDQRGGVEELDGAGDGEGGVGIGPADFGAEENEKRAHPLTSGEEGGVDGEVERVGAGEVRYGETGAEFLVNQECAVFDVSAGCG